MPTYEYHCKACDGDFEVEKRMSDPVDQVCPRCGSPDTQRLISHSSFVLKGSGWYVTDYARKNGSNGSGSHGHRSSASSGSSSGKGDSSSATTSASTGTPSGDSQSRPSPASGPTG